MRLHTVGKKVKKKVQKALLAEQIRILEKFGRVQSLVLVQWTWAWVSLMFDLYNLEEFEVYKAIFEFDPQIIFFMLKKIVLLFPKINHCTLQEHICCRNYLHYFLLAEFCTRFSGKVLEKRPKSCASKCLQINLTFWGTTVQVSNISKHF